MAWDIPSNEVALPSPDLLQSAYESVRPHLRPEDVPAALTRDIGPGVCVSSAERLHSGDAISDPCITSYSPYSKVDERSTLTSDAYGAGWHGQDLGLAKQQGPNDSRGKSSEQQKGDLTQSKKQSNLGGGSLRRTGVDLEHRQERVIQHRDRSTTYTLGGPRCSRTDGKHWQCKREALPDQKYCEKHLHRGLLRSRKRRRGDDFQDLEGERLFQGWQRAKQAQQLWPGLGQPPPEMDQNPILSQSGLPSQAPFLIPSLQVPSTVDSPHLATGPPAALGQWTPAQEQILKATLSKLGLDENNALRRSSSAIAELRARSLRQEIEGSPWADLRYDSSGPPRPLLPLPKSPNVLRVGQDQAVLQPSAHFCPEGDGTFTVAIPIATLGSVGVGVNADGLISAWGCGVPIHIAFGGTSEVVKLEAVRKDGDTVVFKGRPRAGLEVGEGGRPLTTVHFEGPGLTSVTSGKRGAVIPWDGETLPDDSAGQKGAKGLNLDLNLHAAAVETGGAGASRLEPPSWKSPGPSFLKKPPLSPLKKGSSLGCAAQESWGRYLQTLDARSEIRPPHELGADSVLGLLHRLEWESGGDRRGQGAPRVAANDGGAGLRRTVSLSAEKPDGGAPLHRTGSLPVEFGLGPTPPKSDQPLLSKLNVGPGVDTEGTLALGGLSLGGMGKALVGNVASVILQTPRGVFLGGGVKLDEMETKGSCDGSASREKPRAMSDGQGSQSGKWGDSVDSASSPLKSRKRARDGGLHQVGFSTGGLTLALPDPGQGCEKGRRTDPGERTLSTSLSVSDLNGPAVGGLRAPANGAGFENSGPGGGNAREGCLPWHGSETRAVEMQFFPVATRVQSKGPNTVRENDGRPSIGGQGGIAKRLTGGFDKRAGLQVLTGPHARAQLLPFVSSGLEPSSLWKGEGARASFEAARGSGLTAKDLIGPIKSIPRTGGLVWGAHNRVL